MCPNFRERRTRTPAFKEWNTRTFGKCSTPRRPDLAIIPRSGPSLYSGYFSYHMSALIDLSLDLDQVQDPALSLSQDQDQHQTSDPDLDQVSVLDQA